MNRLIHVKKATRLFVVVVGLACLGLLTQAQAVSPPPDGCYPTFTTAEGCDALNSLTTGSGNTAVGWRSLFLDTTGSFNTGVGVGALLLNNGDSNTAVGAAALLANTTGSNNTAIGTDALALNDTGAGNTATGYFALMNNTSGGSNTATGFNALTANTTGVNNTAMGHQALATNLDGFTNTAVGTSALELNTTGFANTAVGFGALDSNTEGGANTAIGRWALLNNTTGAGNTALGRNAGLDITGSGNVCIGANVAGAAGVNNTTWIGNVYTTVQPVVGTDPDVVTINSDGRLGRANVSSRRYKHDIKPMAKASEAIYSLEPVSFRYKKEYDATQTIAFGLIAEEVAEVSPDLVGRNAEGQPESVRYKQINAMLLNEFLKDHHKVENLEATVAEQQKQIKVLIVGLQQVSDELKLSRSAPRVVQND